jgi:DNA polymerase-3 subunit delta'
MNFSSIPGQKETVKKLLRSVQDERVSHAQLFTGPEGCGSLALALAYAKYIHCENRTGDDSCGTCKSCVKHEKMIHPDLHFVFPVAKAESVSEDLIAEWREFVIKNPFFSVNQWFNSLEMGNAQGGIFASEASEIIRKLSFKPFEADYKIMIIWLPERMAPVTSNKLLKMIEEPPEKTVILLVSDEPDKLLPTILSRCQLVKIPAFGNDELMQYLLSSCNQTAEKVADLARVANGNILRALSLIRDEEVNAANLNRFKNLMRFAWKRDVLSMIDWAEEIAVTGREAQKSFIIFSLRLLRENLMLTLGQLRNGLVYLTGEESDFSGKFHPFITAENIDSLAGEFNLVHSHIECNGNARIVFLDLALKVTRFIR